MPKRHSSRKTAEQKTRSGTQARLPPPDSSPGAARSQPQRQRQERRAAATHTHAHKARSGARPRGRAPGPEGHRPGKVGRALAGEWPSDVYALCSEQKEEDLSLLESFTYAVYGKYKYCYQ